METNKQLAITLLKEAIELLQEEEKKKEEKTEDIRDRIVRIAKKYEGGKYLYGGKDMSKIMTTGVDCSGFVQGVLREAGVKNVPSYAVNSTGMRTWGKEKKEVEKGDIICYNGHVAIYIGNGKIMNCGSTPIREIDYTYKPIITIRDVSEGI